jgi:hypothetical protein
MSKPTRDEIRQRKTAIAQSTAHYRAEFNRGARTVATCLQYLHAHCPHPPEARKSEYVGSHFEHRCSDCGKLFT